MAIPKFKPVLVDDTTVPDVQVVAEVPLHPIQSFDNNLFDTAFYLAQNPDVANSGVDPLKHFTERGHLECRNPSAWFSVRYYRSTNADVAASGLHPLAHYATYGWKEKRDPAESFSIRKYLNAYPDVAAAGVDPLLHYMVYGRVDGRVAFHV